MSHSHTYAPRQDGATSKNYKRMITALKNMGPEEKKKTVEGFQAVYDEWMAEVRKAPRGHKKLHSFLHPKIEVILTKKGLFTLGV